MLRSTVGKVMWVGRAMAFLVGLAIILAVVLGVASAALAAVPGDPFRLGKLNAIDAVSQLVGSVTGPMLKIDNNGGGPALRLESNANRPPLTVNADAGKALNLNADKLDGKDADELRSKALTAANDSKTIDDQSVTTLASLSLPGPGLYVVMATTTIGFSGSGDSRLIRCEISETSAGRLDESFAQVGDEAGSARFAVLSIHAAAKLKGGTLAFVCNPTFGSTDYSAVNSRLTAIRVAH